MEEMEIYKINSQDILNSIDLNKINQIEKKKRGRPKKTQQMLTSIPKLKIQSGEEEDLEEEEIILHLPISKAELMQINSGEYYIDDIVEKKNLSSTEQQESDEISDKDIPKTNDNYIKQLILTVKKLKEENDELKKYLNDITPMYFTEVKV